jgi:flagellar biosynthesis GTPase FlhF
LLCAHGAFAQRTTYCCTDENGRQACSDILPTQCYGRAYRELNERGITVKRHDAPLSAEQRAQREAEKLRRQEEERVAQEQRRKDQALLNTYASVQDIELFRDRAIRDLEKQIAEARDRQGEFIAKRKQFQAEAEFYAKKPMPAELSNAIKDNEAEIQAQQSVVDSKLRDIETVKAKFDEDKRRYLEISRSLRRGTGAAASGSGGGPNVR